jgi:hypothetical protein
VSHFFQVVISVAALLFEITLSKFSRQKIMINSDAESELTKKLNFTYNSKCTDFKNAMNQLTLLQASLLREEELNILVLEATQIPRYNHTEISILLVFELKNHNILDKIVTEFNVFTSFLDSLSRM